MCGTKRIELEMWTLKRELMSRSRSREYQEILFKIVCAFTQTTRDYPYMSTKGYKFKESRGGDK